MMENARKRCHLANTGTSVKSEEDHTARVTAFKEKLEVLEHRAHQP